MIRFDHYTKQEDYEHIDVHDAAVIGSDLEHGTAAVCQEFFQNDTVILAKNPLTQSLRRFATASYHAKRARLRGDICCALEFEQVAQGIYSALPSAARW